MRTMMCLMTTLLILSACDNAKEQGQDTVRQLSGGGMIEQEKAMKQNLQKIDRQQQERNQQLNEQLNQQADGQ